MPDQLRPYISRLVAAAMLWLTSWIGTQFGITVAEEIQRYIVELVVVLIIYSITHKAVDSKVNPVDAARTSTAKAHSDHPNP